MSLFAAFCLGVIAGAVILAVLLLTIVYKKG